jgi:pimeloyl-ACP methyl ester carboxylesterase
VTVLDWPLSPVLPGYAGRYRARWLVLHGWAQGAPYWTPLARRLAADGVVLACPDMPALADSCRAPAGSLERMVELADLLAERCRLAGISAVIGHSAGSALALLLAHRLPAVRKLVLIEPLPHHIGLPEAPAAPVWVGDREPSPEEPLPQRLRRRYPFAAEETLSTIAAELGSSESRDAPRAGPPDLRRRAAVYEALTGLPVDLVLVRGARSALLSAEHARAVVDAAPSGQECVLAAAGHSAHVDQPRAVAELLVRSIMEG